LCGWSQAAVQAWKCPLPLFLGELAALVQGSAQGFCESPRKGFSVFK
jgi:hypothetical protein